MQKSQKHTLLDDIRILSYDYRSYIDRFAGYSEQLDQLKVEKDLAFLLFLLFYMRYTCYYSSCFYCFYLFICEIHLHFVI